MNELMKRESQEMTCWNDLEEVRKQFAEGLKDKEFEYFVALGRAIGANPFLKEIWAVKYDASKPASIFCGRDFYRKKAECQPDYDGHLAEAVYSNDKFEMANGIPLHAYDFKDRGELLGAYCIVFRKGISRPFYVFVKLSEYNRGQANWRTMPETMIKKVAESQGLRGAFQGLFQGTLDESECFQEVKPEKTLHLPLAITEKPVEVKIESRSETPGITIPKPSAMGPSEVPVSVKQACVLWGESNVKSAWKNFRNIQKLGNISTGQASDADKYEFLTNFKKYENPEVADEKRQDA